MKACLILEDVPEAREWMKAVLSSLYPQAAITTAATCLQASTLLAEKDAPDLALLDLGLPDGSGLSVLDKIKSMRESSLCVVTTIFDDDKHVFDALSHGADGYLLKDQSQQELIQMLAYIEQGQPPLSPAIARRILKSFHPESHKENIELTTRETEVLTLIAKGHTVSETARLLDISHHTVGGYVKELYRKLKVNSRAEATMEAIRLGIVR